MPILVITTTRQSTQAFKAQAVETVTQALHHTVSELLADIHADGSKRDSRMRWQWMAMVVDSTKVWMTDTVAEVQQTTRSRNTTISRRGDDHSYHYNIS